MWRLVWAMFGIICIFQLLDAYQTSWLLQLEATEFNPIIRASIKQFGIIPGLLIPKFISSIILGVVLYWYQKKEK